MSNIFDNHRRKSSFEVPKNNGQNAQRKQRLADILKNIEDNQGNGEENRSPAKPHFTMLVNREAERKLLEELDD